MILTEEQAKTKRCQESFGQHYTSRTGDVMMAGGPTPYFTVEQSSPTHCIGSGCMAWRWSKTHNLGYCGKAGVP